MVFSGAARKAQAQVGMVALGAARAHIATCAHGKHTIADDGRLPRSARSGGLACCGAPFRPSGSNSRLPWPSRAGRSSTGRRPSKILAWQTVAPALLHSRRRAWASRHHPLGSGARHLHLGPAARRRTEMDRRPFGGRLSFSPRRRHADSRRFAAWLADAADLGAATLQIRIAIRATGRRLAALLGWIWHFGAAAAADRVGAIRIAATGAAVSCEWPPCEDGCQGRSAGTVTFLASMRCYTHRP